MTRRRTPKWLTAARTPGASGDWLGRALPRAGVMPPAELEVALREGRVRVGEKVVTDPFTPVPANAPVFVDAAEVSLAAKTRVLAFHKAAGVVTHATDPEGKGTVFEALHSVLSAEDARFGWHAVGRLDRDTTGLLLFTNDERFVAHATSPEMHLPKRYVARVSGEPTNDKLRPLREGLTLDDGPTRPAEARVRASGVVELVLTEGRHHQVKRMLAAVGLPVVQLHREAVGDISCDVEVGRYRALSDEEVRTGLRFDPTARLGC